MRNYTAYAKLLVGVLSVAFLSFTTVAAEAQYQCRWDHVLGGGVGGDQPWTTGWVPGHPTPECGASAVGRVCGGEDFSGPQRSGSEIGYWPQGCAGPRWRLVCTCRPE